MNITIVLAVYNNFELTKNCYEDIRKKYPTVPIVISDGGSFDDTKSWGYNINDENVYFIGCANKLTFSENYNTAVNTVKTDKLVLVHNDMIFGEMFLENIEKHIDEKTILSYTTIEPPIFSSHSRAGKIIKDFGSSFHDFNHNNFNTYVQNQKNNHNIYDGASFFMSIYKSTFLDIGGFDGKTFFPYFCEDDDFLLRAKLKGYQHKTLSSSVVYHFVSKTSRFSDEYKNQTNIFEHNSNKNFIRKWGIPISEFNNKKYWLKNNFVYNKINTTLISNNYNLVISLEPFFDNITTTCDVDSFIKKEQENTPFSLYNKFTDKNEGNLVFYCEEIKNDITLQKMMSFKTNYQKYQKGKYSVGDGIMLVK